MLTAVVDWQSGITFIVIATAVAGVFTIGAARAWKNERDATRDKVDRLEEEIAEERTQQAENVVRLQAQFEAEREQQHVIRHDLKDELNALRKLRDPTEVLQHVLAKFDTTVEAVAGLLERAEKRAAARDAAIIKTQREIVDRLERLADRLPGQVAEVVQQLQAPEEET